MSNFSSLSSNSPQNSSSASGRDWGSPSIDNAPNLIPPPPPFPLPFPIFPPSPQVFLPQDVQPWKDNEEEDEDSKELWLKVEEDAAYDTFIRIIPRHRRRRRTSRTSSDSSVTASSNSSSNSKETYSSSDFEDDEGEDKDEEEEEEKDLAPSYPQEDSDLGVDSDVYKLCSP